MRLDAAFRSRIGPSSNCPHCRDVVTDVQHPSSNPPPDPATDRVDSWKEIARYLNRDESTVQRWEKREGLPVHRHQHDERGTAYAYSAEIDCWLEARTRPLVVGSE